TSKARNDLNQLASTTHAPAWKPGFMTIKMSPSWERETQPVKQRCFSAECCRTRTVHLLVRRRLGKDMSDYLIGRIHAAPNIVVHEGVEVASVHGERRLEGVSLREFNPNRDEPANQTNGHETLPVSAVFVFIGAEPGGEWLPDLVARDPLGYVLTGVDAIKSGRWPLATREPCPLETTVPGILAAGDIRSG